MTAITPRRWSRAEYDRMIGAGILHEDERVQLAARVNNVAVFAEIIGTVVLSVVVFFAWVRGGTPDGHGFGFLFTVSSDQPLGLSRV